MTYSPYILNIRRNRPGARIARFVSWLAVFGAMGFILAMAMR